MKVLDLKSDALLTVSIPAEKSVTALIPLLNLGLSNRIIADVVYFLFFSLYMGTAIPAIIANTNANTNTKIFFFKT